MSEPQTGRAPGHSGPRTRRGGDGRRIVAAAAAIVVTLTAAAAAVAVNLGASEPAGTGAGQLSAVETPTTQIPSGMGSATSIPAADGAGGAAARTGRTTVDGERDADHDDDRRASEAEDEAHEHHEGADDDD